MAVEIIEILRRSEQGATQPFICRGDDDEIYFVKGSGAGRRSQICEWIAGHLGQSLGLPIAPFEIVEVPSEILEIPVRTDLAELGEGPAFGSRKHNVTELTFSRIAEVPEQQQRDVLAFDWWIRNADRFLSAEGGNPNLFWDAETAELVVLDHNQAFDSEFDFEDFRDFHVFSDQWASLFGDLLRRTSYKGRFVAALNEWPGICDTIPQEWHFADAEMTVPVDFDLNAAHDLLARCHGNEFWNP